MAQTKKVASNAPNKKRPSAIEMKEIERKAYLQELYTRTQNAIKLLDLNTSQSRNYTIYNKERLRVFMRNPLTNENNLRNLSRFLYRVSQPYKRLVNYNAQQMDLSAMVVIPNIDITKSQNDQALLKNYYNTCVEADKMNLPFQMYKMLVTAWVEDAAYGYIYEDDTGFFIYLLDGEYCKISSVNDDGTYNFAFDFSYFRSRTNLLDYWDPEFEKKYNIYVEDSSQRWQELETDRTVCLKVASEDPTLCIPPYVGLFEAIIDNIDLQSIVAVKDELSIYKLLVARLEHLKDSPNPDEFEVDIDSALEYFSKLEASLPEGIAAAISPVPIEPIEFKGTSTDDTDMIAKSMGNLFKISGGSLVLNDEKSGASIYRAHIIADAQNALKPLLGEIQLWANRYISYVIKNASKLKFLETTPWLKNEKKKELIESAQYGVPVKMAVGVLDGFSSLDLLRMQYFENDVLDLHDVWIPLQSTHTQSSDSNGKDDSDLTDEGEVTKEKEKNKM